MNQLPLIGAACHKLFHRPSSRAGSTRKEQVATLIPALGSCAARMTSGERRLAERLEQKLDDDYLLWYDVPVGPKQTHPDFVIIHPRRGLLILEVKDWRLETIKSATRERFGIAPDGQPRTCYQPAWAGQAAVHPTSSDPPTSRKNRSNGCS